MPITSAVTNITTDNTVFVLVSFEGPDHYSLAGGLGVRVTNLSQTLAGLGFATHLFFVGDPRKEGEEIQKGSRLTLHRWCQWLSEYYPNGVYQGEYEKINDFNNSIPSFVTEHIVKPAVKQDKLVVILGEEWHTAETMCRVHDLLLSHRLRDKVVMFWNANNTYGFDHIDWRRLVSCVTLTTVSRYMKQIMSGRGLNPLVVPNGIPRSWLNSVIDDGAVARLKRSLDADLILTKVARWDPNKRWDMAVEAIARLKADGSKAVLLARGGIEPYGYEVMQKAYSLGLTVKEARTEGDTIDRYLQAIGDAGRADILNIRFHCPQDFLQILYQASNAVLANSSHEPFGLVGLETMAAGGVAFIGGTGEDYAIPFHNSIVLETADPKEIEDYVMYLAVQPAEEKRIRRAARRTAGLFVWEEVMNNLMQKLEFQARVQGLLAIPKPVFTLVPKLSDYLDKAPLRQPVPVA